MKLLLIAEQLKLWDWQVSKALVIAKMLDERGVSDWFVPLTSKADLPPGWPRSRHKTKSQVTEGAGEGEGAESSGAA